MKPVMIAAMAGVCAAGVGAGFLVASVGKNPGPAPEPSELRGGTAAGPSDAVEPGPAASASAETGDASPGRSTPPPNPTAAPGPDGRSASSPTAPTVPIFDDPVIPESVAASITDDASARQEAVRRSIESIDADAALLADAAADAGTLGLSSGTASTDGSAVGSAGGNAGPGTSAEVLELEGSPIERLSTSLDHMREMLGSLRSTRRELELLRPQTPLEDQATELEGLAGAMREIQRESLSLHSALLGLLRGEPTADDAGENDPAAPTDDEDDPSVRDRAVAQADEPSAAE